MGEEDEDGIGRMLELNFKEVQEAFSVLCHPWYFRESII
jgi:hypothetical protein